MYRAARTPLEARFVANLHIVLPRLLGEPEQDDGREMTYHDAVGKVCVTYSKEDPNKTGVFVRRHDNLGGAGFDFLELFGITVQDVEEALTDLEDDEGSDQPPPERPVTEARSAPLFHEILATARDDDGRIALYLTGRGLPDMAGAVRLVTLRGRRLAMASLAIDPIVGDPLAVQVLPLDSLGRPAVVAGKKVRLTFAAIRGWTHDAAFRIPALEDGSAEVVLVEGTEDALSVRAAGWTGPVVATLGKGNIAKHSPPGTAVNLSFDGDVPKHEIDYAVEAHRRANRTVRVAMMPDGLDPNDMVLQGRGAELLELLTGAGTQESKVVEIEKALLQFPFDAKGHARYMTERRELAKRFKVPVFHLDEVRERLAKANKPDDDVKVGRPVICEVEPCAYPVDGSQLLLAVVRELASIVIFPGDEELPAGAVATALWLLTTHSFEPFPPNGSAPDDLFDTAARLMISAGTIRAGKTRLLDCIYCLGRRVLRASSLSAAVLFRACEAIRPLVLLDEVDQARLHDDGSAVVQLINDGFEPNGMAWRVGGEKHDRLDAFRVFTPVALAGIGRLPPAVEDRSIRITLLRKTPDRKTARLDKNKKVHLRTLASQIRRWVTDERRVIKTNLDPAIPEGITNDRDVDLWIPLLAIADTLGDDIPALARKAMIELTSADHDPSLGEELMSTLYDILIVELAEHPRVSKIALPRLTGLVNASEGPWMEMRNGAGCDSRWLSKTLKNFQLTAKHVRDPLHSEQTARGYDILEVLAVTRLYRSTEQDDDETQSAEHSAASSTSSTPSTDDGNSLKNKNKKGGSAVDGNTSPPTSASTSQSPRSSRKRVNPIRGARARDVDKHASSTTPPSSTKSASGVEAKTTSDSKTYKKQKSGVDDVDDVDAKSEGSSAPFYTDQLPRKDESSAPTAIDLTLLEPEDLLTAELKFYGYTVGPAPDFKVQLPEDMPNDDPDAYAQVCAIVDEHRAIAWRRFLTRPNGSGHDAR